MTAASAEVRETPERVASGAEATYFVADNGIQDASEAALGYFTASPELLRLVPLALAVGAFGAGISLALLDMIGFCIGTGGPFGAEGPIILTALADQMAARGLGGHPRG